MFDRVHLCVKPPNVEEDCSSLKGHSLLGARHSRERVIPEREVIYIAATFGQLWTHHSKWRPLLLSAGKNRLSTK